MERLTDVVKRNQRKLWTIFLLIYSVSVLASSFLARPLPVFLYLVFMIFMPGYAFAEALFPKLQLLEKLTVSIGFSLALLAGLHGLIEAFDLEGLLSEITIVEIVTIICLLVLLVKSFRK